VEKSFISNLKAEECKKKQNKIVSDILRFVRVRHKLMESLMTRSIKRRFKEHYEHGCTH